MKTVIEINGRKYDARTGQILTTDSTRDTSGSQSVVRRAPVLDGVSRRKPASPMAVPAVKPAVPQQAVSAPAKKPSAHPGAARALDIKPSKHKIQRARTLLRSAVKKPQKTAPQIHSTATITKSNVERSATGRGVLLKRVPDSRIARARQTAKSAAIQKFGSVKSVVSTPKLSKDLTVAQPPKNTTAAPEAAPILTKPVLGNAHQTKQQVFNHPIAQANHHAAPKLKKASLKYRVARKLKVNPRAISISAGALAVILLAGFFAYQNVPAVAMRVAANRAGFSGHLPTNPPAGFAFKGPIKYGKGTIAVNYNSNTDDRTFTIVQRPTDWTSDSLLANYVLSTKVRYQTYHDRGLTVFVYNNGSATWVDKGVWYNLDGNGALSSDQILAIAGSM